MEWHNILYIHGSQTIFVNDFGDPLNCTLHDICGF